MKIAVLSDTHGRTTEAIDAIMKIEDIELLIHLGDHSKDAKRIMEALNMKGIYVSGNCDIFDNEGGEEKVFVLEGKKIFATHGHQYDVKTKLNSLFYRGKEIGADIVLYGHSHIPNIVEHEGIMLFNPGSPTVPRYGGNKTIGLLELGDSVQARIIDIE